MNARVSGHSPPPGTRSASKLCSQPAQHSGMRDGRAGVTADQGMRRTSGKPKPPRDQIPNNRAYDPAQDHLGSDQAKVDEAFSNRLRHRCSEEECRGEIEECRPRTA